MYTWSLNGGTPPALGASTSFDVMSYCVPAWISDYNYEALLSARLAAGPPVAAIADAGAECECLLVWGTVEGDEITINPAFVVRTRSQPAAGGSFLVEGVREDGRVAFAQAFEPSEIDHAPGVRHFAMAIPLRFSKSIGLNPVMIGMKILLIEERDKIPQVSLIGHMSLPRVASPDFAATYFAPSFRFTIQHSLTEKISLGYNLGAQWDSETAVPTFIYTLVTGFSLAEKIGAYIEAYGFAPQYSMPDHRIDGGFTFCPKSNMQFDLSGGIGLSDNAPDFYGSLGFSMRLPK
jgi:hypothetical protein